jgi:hypothetical protein
LRRQSVFADFPCSHLLPSKISNMIWRKHLFLWTLFGLFAVIVLLVLSAQLNPSCLSWKREVEARLDLSLGDPYKHPNDAAWFYHVSNGTQSWEEMRRQVSWMIRQDLRKERPAGCF